MQLMLDLETLDTKPSAIVLSIGAVMFDNNGINSEFYSELNFESQLLDKRTQSQSTMNWWLNQQVGRKFELPVGHYYEQLGKFNGWLERQLNELVNLDNFRVWGNGSTFDISIFESINQPVKPLWHYFQIRDLRTFREFVADNAPIEDYFYDGEKHNALIDARAQAKYVIYHMRKSGKWTDPTDNIPF